MFTSRPPFRSAWVIALLGLFPAAASAQLKDAQEKGWSLLKDGYALVASMKDNKSNRTRANFETALGKLDTSMVNMTRSIDAMGERVADEDKSYAAGLRDNIRNAYRAVADAHEKTRRAFDAAKESPEKLAEISDELDKLKAALEQYEVACKAAYLNYKARWDDLKSAMDKMDADIKSARDKLNALEKQNEALIKEGAALAAEITKANEETAKLDKAAFDIFLAKESLKQKFYGAYDSKSEEYKRAKADLDKAWDMQARVIDLQIANGDKITNLETDKRRKLQESAKLAKEIKSAADPFDKLDMKMFQRYSLWDAEFPAKSYAFQTLR